MNPVIVPLVTTVLKDFVLPWVAKKKDEPTKTPKDKKEKGVKGAVQEVKEEFHFSPKRTAINAGIAAALLFAVDAGYISLGTADCAEQAAQEVIEKIETKQE